MVGPSQTKSERDDAMGRLRLFVIGLVGASGGLVSLYADASLPVVALAVLGGAVAGAIIWWYLVQTYRNGLKRERGESDDFEKRERFK